MSNPIESLTPEQQAKIKEYTEHYYRVGISTEPSNKPKAEAALKAHYAYQGLPEPMIVWRPSPFSGSVLAAKVANHAQGNDLPVDEVLNTLPNVTDDQVRQMAATASYGSFNAYWVAYYAFISEQVEKNNDPLINIVKDIVEECGVYWTFSRLVIITEKPVSIKMKDDKLHCEDDMALKYSDGTGLYCIDGKTGKSLLEILANQRIEED